VVTLLRLERSQIHNIQSALRSLERNGDLLEVAARSTRYNNPFYTLPRQHLVDPQYRASPLLYPTLRLKSSSRCPSIRCTQCLLFIYVAGSRRLPISAASAAAPRISAAVAHAAVRPPDPQRVVQLIGSNGDGGDYYEEDEGCDEDVVVIKHSIRREEKHEKEEEDADDAGDEEEEEGDEKKIDIPLIDSPAPPCSICHRARATEVFMPCRHQLCCRECWGRWKREQAAIHRKNEGLRRQLAVADPGRAVFEPVCPHCRQRVDDVISPFQG